MRNFWLILSVLWLWTCSGGGDKATGPEEPPIVINLTSLGGQAQKGPFNNGTAINIAELTNTLSPTGRNFSSAITDNTGRFAVANVQLESPYVELRANGYYFNEVSNEISSGQLTLFALSNLTGKTSLNVNILTHLEKNRMVTLMSGDNPKTFAQAKLQAQEEVLAIFDYSRANVPESELLDISQGGTANAKLLAMSAIIQGNLTVGQMSQLLANISTDIASDGTLDDSNLIDTLISNTQGLDISQVRSNLETHYSSLGVSATIPDFESEINQFLKPPVSQDINASTAEDTPINITLAGSDPEGESLTYTILEVNNATVTLNGNVATYTPDAHFNGTDTFTYYANDGTSDSNIATVTMTVSAEDDEPNTLDVATTTDEDVAVAVNLSAEEYDGDSYSFAIVTDVSNGTTSLNGSTVTYTPNQDFNGEDSFTFQATDDTGRTINVATATITVNAVNDAPVANDITNQVTDENRMMQLDITLDATDVDGDALTYNIASTNNGSVTINDNIATYVPNQDWNGEDTFTYNVNDGTVDSNTATVTITVNSIPDAPVAYDISSSVDEDMTGHTLKIVGDSEGGSDVDGDALTFSIISPPSNGSIYNEVGGGIPDGDALVAGDELTSYYTIYNPNENYHGTDTFTFKANDGLLDSNIATVTITVNPILDLFYVKDAAFEVDEDNELQVNIDDSYIGTNPDGLSMNDIYFSIPPQNGTATNTGILMMYTPNDNFNGTDTFAYRGSHIAGGNATSSDWSLNEATITITVNPVDDLPTAIDFTASTAEDNSIDIALQYEDVDGDTWPDLTYEIWTQPSNGSVVLDATKKIATYTPNSGFFGTDEFVYSTEAGSSESGTVTVTVEEVVGDLTLFPDLTEGYSERFSDIVYDNSTGGYIVAGFAHNKSDGGWSQSGGNTWNMFMLSTDSFGDTNTYEYLNNQSGFTWDYPKQNSTHLFDISRVSHDGSYLLSKWSNALLSVDSSGSSVSNSFSGSIESGFNSINNVSNTFQLVNGNYIILGNVTDVDNTQAEYPIIAEIDQNLNVQNYKILDNHVTDSSLTYSSYYNRMVYNHNDGVVYVIAQTNILGFNNSNQLNYYEVNLPDATGSNTFTVNRYENLSDISGSPTQMYIQGENSDVMTYKRNSNGYDEFIIATEESSGQLMLVYYRLMDNGSKEIIETFYPNHSGNHDFMELVDSGNRYYLVAQEGGDIRVQSVFDTENFSTQFDKLLDITSLGYEDKLGGATASNFYNNASGLAITGSTRKDSTEDWDGFILLLDLNGD